MPDFEILRSKFKPIPLTRLELYKLQTKGGIALNPVDAYTFLEHYEGCMLQIVKLRAYYLRSFIALIASMIINVVFIATLIRGL